jgi:hypothetical protein
MPEFDADMSAAVGESACSWGGVVGAEPHNQLMTRRMTPQQYAAAVQRAAREQRRAIDKYNREARAYNNKLAPAARDQQRAIDKHNRDVREHNNRVASGVREYNRQVSQYNFKVRAYNREVANQRQRLHDEIRRISSRPATVWVTYRSSVQSLATSYEAFEDRYAARSHLSDTESQLRDWASAEAANSAYLVNALEGDTASDDDTTAEELSAPSMTTELSAFSVDLVSRWTGALFALNPRNPDAARHFCTSAREVLTTMLNSAAPDSSVLASDPGCERTENGVPTRRAKVRYLLTCKGITEAALDAFVDADLDNIVKLFRMFNDGTHGHAERFSIPQLAALRTRVESAIAFVYRLTT